jgi:hypothetical protein
LFDLLDVAQNTLYVSDNQISIYPTYADYQLFYCCNDFGANAPNTQPGNAARRVTRHDYPALTYLPGSQLLSTLPAQVGAQPADPLERRWRDSTLSQNIPVLDYGTPLANDSFDLDFDPAAPPHSPADSDNDGMPDSFEAANAAYGLDPGVADGNGSALSLPYTGVSGYTNLECYLNWLADQRSASAALIYASGFEG